MDNKQKEAKLAKSLLAVGVAFAFTFLNAIYVRDAFNWFFAPLFGREITYWWAYGISWSLSLIGTKPYVSKEEQAEDPSRTVARIFAFEIAMALAYAVLSVVRLAVA